MSQVGMQNNANIVQSSDQFTGKIDLDKFKLNTATDQIEIRSNFSKVIHNIKNCFRSNEAIDTRNAYLIGAMKRFVSNERAAGLRNLGFNDKVNVLQDSVKFSPAQKDNIAAGKAVLDKAQNIFENIDRQFSIKTALTVISGRTDNVNLLNQIQNWITEDFGKKPECSKFVKENIIDAFESVNEATIKHQYCEDVKRNGITSVNGQPVPAHQTNDDMLAFFKGKVPDSALNFVQFCCTQIFVSPLANLAVNTNNNVSHLKKMAEDNTVSIAITPTLPIGSELNDVNIAPISNNDIKCFIDIDNNGITVRATTSYRLQESTMNDDVISIYDKKGEMTVHIPYPIVLNDKGMPNFELTNLTMK